MRTRVDLTINGSRKNLSVDEESTLLTLLRDEMGLTGTKYGCGEGECGACTVLVDGEPARSCLTRVSAVSGKEVTTIEGLEHDGQLHPVQAAFLEEGALQCGYCTPGMIMSAAALLNGSPHPTRAEIVESMNGNICRCGVYQRIIAAINRAAALRKEAAR